MRISLLISTSNYCKNSENKNISEATTKIHWDDKVLSQLPGLEHSKRAAEAAKETSWTFLMEAAAASFTLLFLKPTTASDCWNCLEGRDGTLEGKSDLGLMADGSSEAQIKDEAMMIGYVSISYFPSIFLPSSTRTRTRLALAACVKVDDDGILGTRQSPVTRINGCYLFLPSKPPSSPQSCLCSVLLTSVCRGNQVDKYSDFRVLWLIIKHQFFSANC